MTRLCELADKYGSDKRAGRYTEFYDLILAGRAVRSVLEIGIGTREAMKHVPGYRPGASLRMWADYFPEAQVVGMDVNPAALISGERIFSRVGDQKNRGHLIMLAQEFGPFDLIVDDGDHSPAAQVLAAVTLHPFLADGGLYFIEDAHPQTSDTLPLVHTVITTGHEDGLYKGSLILIQKRAASG